MPHRGIWLLYDSSSNFKAKLDRVGSNDPEALCLQKAIIVSSFDEVPGLEVQSLMLQKNPGLIHLVDHHSIDFLPWGVDCGSLPSWNLLLDHGAAPTTLNKSNNNLIHYPLCELRSQTTALFFSNVIRRYGGANGPIPPQWPKRQ